MSRTGNDNTITRSASANLTITGVADEHGAEGQVAPGPVL